MGFIMEFLSMNVIILFFALHPPKMFYATLESQDWYEFSCFRPYFISHLLASQVPYGLH